MHDELAVVAELDTQLAGRVQQRIAERLDGPVYSEMSLVEESHAFSAR